MVLGSEQTLDLVPRTAGRARPHRRRPAARSCALIEANLGRKRIAVVAGGDPLFYGVARYLCDRLGKERFEVLPHVSSMQLAFARIKESWEEAYLTNLADAPAGDRPRPHPHRRDGRPVHQRAGGPAARRPRSCWPAAWTTSAPTSARTSAARTSASRRANWPTSQDMEFAPLNVMILKRKPGRPDQRRAPGRFRRFGNPDDVFAQSRPKSGLITQAEVRAIALAQLAIQPGSVVWDIGAGSGSVAIEAAQLSDPGMVYAIEQDAADYHLILANAETFGVRNLKAVHGTAPAVFAGLPAPDAIFVGGTGQEVGRLLEAAYAGAAARRPAGRQRRHAGEPRAPPTRR